MESIFEKNWRVKTLENLEKDFWGAPTYTSHLVTTCHKLRKKPLEEFKVEDLRIMIGQNIGLKYLIPLAIEILENDLLVEGELYEGDLLKSVLASDEVYWKLAPKNWKKVKDLFNKKKDELKNYDTIWDIKKEWFKSFSVFEKIN
jgi:hypothetical protein